MFGIGGADCLFSVVLFIDSFETDSSFSLPLSSTGTHPRSAALSSTIFSSFLTKDVAVPSVSLVVDGDFFFRDKFREDFAGDSFNDKLSGLLANDSASESDRCVFLGDPQGKDFFAVEGDFFRAELGEEFSILGEKFRTALGDVVMRGDFSVAADETKKVNSRYIDR